jgi:thiamine biosynthesis lipoprotein
MFFYRLFISLSLGLCLLLSCQAQDTVKLPQAEQAVMPRHDFYKSLMGTPWEIAIYTDDFLNASEVAKSAFYEVERIEKRFSSWIEQSEISQINQRTDQYVEIAQETYIHLSLAKSISLETSKAFDITWAALQGLWDFRAKKKPSHGEIVQRLAWVDSQRLLDLKEENQRYYAKLHAGSKIELGAITKGYAVEQAAKRIKMLGFKNFIVNGGGDLWVGGQKEGNTPWTIGIRHPRNGKIFGELTIHGDQAVVSSGDYERYFEDNGQIFHHIIDLRTGYPAQLTVSITVVAQDATIADAYATALFVLGPKEGMKLLQKHPEIKAVFLAPDGTVSGSEELTKQLEKRWK